MPPPDAQGWFSSNTPGNDLKPPERTLKGPNEFHRLWRGFMTARVTLGAMLLILQTALWALGSSRDTWLIFLCGGYLAIAIAVRFYSSPRQLDNTFTMRWVLTIGVDIATFSALQILQGGSINYSPLLALPVLLASVLGPLFLAMGTAASVSLVLLGHAAWLAVYSYNDVTPYFVQSALTGAGCFVIAFLSSQMSARLAHEELRSHLSHREVQVQRQVNELVIEALTDGILVVDGRGRVRATNPAARQLLGSEQPLENAPFDLASEPAWSDLAVLAARSFVNVDLRRTDVAVRHAGQGLRRLRVRTRLTAGHTDGDESLCVMFLQDQREMEARMRTDKLASMGRMSAAVAHEIRNPLAAISQANALLEEDTVDPKQRQLTQMVAQNVNRLGRIVEEILDISRVQTRDESMPAHSLALDEWVHRISGDWSAQTKSADLPLIVLSGTDAHVAFEPDHLRRVLFNLLDNARRYATGSSRSIQVGTVASPGRASGMFVWSDGLPLEQSVERHLFEPFFSSESRSSGLGLYICRELCDGHGASIIYRRIVRKVGDRDVEGNEFFVSFRTGRSADRRT